MGKWKRSVKGEERGSKWGYATPKQYKGQIVTTTRGRCYEVLQNGEWRRRPDLEGKTERRT